MKGVIRARPDRDTEREKRRKKENPLNEKGEHQWLKVFWGGGVYSFMSKLWSCSIWLGGVKLNVGLICCNVR